ncbi:MAG TPA: hypothetical protein VH877_17495 [Polyangia bacterium]|jgi:hypothetical protein|nr:hypothetical protein [Polyangia bacterium]
MKPKTQPTPSTRTKTPQPKPRRTQATAPPPVAGGQRLYTLDDLRQAEPPDPRLRDIYFRNTKEEDLVDVGRGIDSLHILRAAPDLYGSTHEIMAQLNASQRRMVIGFSPGLLALLAHETLQLAEYKDELDRREQGRTVTRAQTRQARRDAMREGVALRDQAFDALTDVIGGGEELAALRANKGTAETPSELASGLGQLAGQLDDLRARDAAQAELLASLGLGPEYAEELRAAAARVRTTEKAATAPIPDVRVTQRTLDLQDGVVMRLVTVLYRVFRAAQERDGSILMPTLGALRPFLVRASTPRCPDTEPPQTPPQPPTKDGLQETACAPKTKATGKKKQGPPAKAKSRRRR